MQIKSSQKLWLITKRYNNILDQNNVIKSEPEEYNNPEKKKYEKGNFFF